MTYSFPYGSRIGDRPLPCARDRWNSLTLISRHGVNAYGRKLWMCRCVCGREKIVMEQSIRNGRTRSCGCAKKEAARLRRIDPERQALSSLMARYHYHAKRRKLVFELTREQFKFLVTQPCHYCGSLPSAFSHFYKFGKSIGGLLYNGVDREDNGKGYSIDNVVSCCKQCNTAKGKLSLSAFFKWIRKVVRTHATRIS